MNRIVEFGTIHKSIESIPKKSLLRIDSVLVVSSVGISLPTMTARSPRLLTSFGVCWVRMITGPNLIKLRAVLDILHERYKSVLEMK